MNLSDFKIEEVFQFASTIEQGGFDFYVTLIAACDNIRVKNELKFLRDEEAQHKAFFLGELKKKGTTEVKLSAGLDRVLQAEFITPMEEFYRDKKIARTVEALRFGAALEQKTIDFYVDLRKQAKDSDFLRDLDAIIEEENKHKQKLNVILTY